jgi:hypothetical protein
MENKDNGSLGETPPLTNSLNVGGTGVKPSPNICHHCGYCPTCGRPYYSQYPYYPYPNYTIYWKYCYG